MANVTILLLFLMCLLSQGAFCNENISYSYTVGLIYERDSIRDVIIASAKKASSNNFKINFEDLFVEPCNAFECLYSACSLIQRHPTVGIFGSSSKTNVDTIQSICDARNIPNILTEDVGVLEGYMQLSVYPSPRHLTKAYMDVLSSMKWEKFTFLYTSEDHTSWVKFLTEASGHGFVFDTEFLNPHSPDEQRCVIQELKKTGKTHFIVDCLEEDTMQILSIFQNFGMVTGGYHYFFTGIETHNINISTFKSSGVDIVKMQLLGSDALHDPLFKHDFFSNIPKASEVLAFDAVQMFAHALESVKPVQNESVNCENGTEWEDGKKMFNYIVTNPYRGLTGYIGFGPDRYRSKFELSINKLTPNGMGEIGVWDTTRGIKYMYLADYENTVIENWRAKPLVVAISLKEPYARIKASSHPLHGTDIYEGFAIDVIEELSKIENFTYILTIEYKGIRKSEDGRWTGMIGAVLDRKADLAISDITMTFDRVDAVDFTDPIIHTGITILFKKPVKMPPSFYYFARPFSTGIWIAIAVSFVIATTSLFIVGRLSGSEWQKLKATSNYVTSQLTFSNTVWFIAGSLFRQNTQVKIRSIPGRIIAASWWLLCFVVIAMYIAALVSHMAKYEEKAAKLFSDVESLVKNAKEHDIRYGAFNYGSTMEFFKFSRDPLYQEIYQHMVEHPEDMVFSVHDAIMAAETERYAFFTEETTIDYITGQYCQLTKYGGLINQNQQGIIMRKNSPYRNSLNRAILKLSSSGKLDKLKEKWWKGSCDIKVENDETYPLSLADIGGLIFLTIFGIVAALIGAVVEFLLHVHRKSRKLKRSFFKVFKLEVRQCFKGNTKTIVDRNLINKPVPENEDHEATQGVIELT